MLQTNERDRQEQALAILRDMAFTPANRKTIAENDGIQHLADILASDAGQTCCIHAAACLRSLALDLHLATKVAIFAGTNCLACLSTED